MDVKPEPLEYATPASSPSSNLGRLVRGLGLLATAGGVVTAFLGTAGTDDREQIVTGCLIAAFAFTWAILGQILHAVESRR